MSLDLAELEQTLRSTGMAKSESTEAPRFEEALLELEAVVRRLEQGELPLEDSLAAFERGMALVGQLTKRLEDIERRVEVLLRSEDGTPRLRPLDDEE